MRLQRQHLLVNSNVNNECITLHASLHLTSLYGRFCTNTIVLNHVTNVTTTFRPIFKFLDTLQGIG